jgi:hypothetical protein
MKGRAGGARRIDLIEKAGVGFIRRPRSACWKRARRSGLNAGGGFPTDFLWRDDCSSVKIDGGSYCLPILPALRPLLRGHRTMSLLGKILALLNLFGALGLIVLASMTYSKRQGWSYSLLRHGIVLDGLPLDEKEETPNGVPIVDQLSENTLRGLFQSVGGNPVKTQIQEVQRVKQALDGKLQPVSQNKRAQTYLLARILLPLADNHTEREQLLAIRSLLATDASAAEFKKRYLQAFRKAVEPPPAGDEPKPFEETFRAAVRAQGGLPSEGFTSMILRALPNDAKKAAGANIDKVFDETFETQRKQLETRYNDLFDAALKGPPPVPQLARAQAVELQKAAIARLLFGLCTYLAEEGIETNPGQQDAALLKGLPLDSAAFAQRLPDTDAYRNLVKRMEVVCGIRAGLDAISERAVALRKLAADLAATVSEDRMHFVADYAALVEEIKKRADLVQAELALKAETERKFGVQQELVKRREAEIEKHKEDYQKSREQTVEKFKELQKLSDDLLKDRVKARDLIRQTRESERMIRDLEKRIIELERKKP